MATFNKFNQFVTDIAAGVHNLATGTAHELYIALTNSAPGAGNTVLGNITQIAGNNGYTTGGLVCGNGGNSTLLGNQTAVPGTFRCTATLDPVWTGATGPMGTFRYCVLYNTTPTGPVDPLIGWWDYTQTVTLQIGETFTVDLDQTNGLLTIT